MYKIYKETSSYSWMFTIHCQPYISVQCCKVQNLQRNKLIQLNVPQYTLPVLHFSTVLQCTKFTKKQAHIDECSRYTASPTFQYSVAMYKIYKETSSYSRMFHDTHCQSYISVECCKVQNLQRNKLIQLNVHDTLPALHISTVLQGIKFTKKQAHIVECSTIHTASPINWCW